MSKVKTTAAALAIGAGMAMFGGTAAATPAGADGGIGVQCTRQYVVSVRDLELRSSPGGSGNGTFGIAGDIFNVPDASGLWYWGNLYDQRRNHIGSGWTLASNLSYTGVCF